MKEENKPQKEQQPEKETNTISRRTFLRYAGSMAALAGASALMPAYAFPGFESKGPQVLKPQGPDNVIDLTISRFPKIVGGKKGNALGINGTVPGPLLHLKEGEEVVIRVKNALDKESTSIHWHGVLVPFQMDGVPGVTYDGIAAGTTFEYHFTVPQNGTYWYHSHTFPQEQLGNYGPIIIDPAEKDPVDYDRQYPVVLSDWTFENPYKILAHLKKDDGYYNFQKRTIGEFFKDTAENGLGSTLKNYLMWAKMRMSPTDIADVTGFAYTYLMNGLGPDLNWNALFKKGEKVRLRFINSASDTYFDVRIPGLKLTVVQVDGQNIVPVTVDEFRIAIAETYDVIVEPDEKAYTIFAESKSRSGYTRGTLAPRKGMEAPIPKQRPRPTLTMKDMGMKMDMGGMNMGGMDMEGMNMNGMSMDEMDMKSGDMKGMKMKKDDIYMKTEPVKHGPDHHGKGAASIAQWEFNRLGDPGMGLEHNGRKVLTYSDLKSLEPNTDDRPPDREIELHLTGNMERYVWGFNGKQFRQTDSPIPFKYGERLKLILVNDTMMAHPIHLHGMYMELANGQGRFRPRKHTVNVQPAERMALLITAYAPGRWAFHCHILYHMVEGMFRVVEVANEEGDIYLPNKQKPSE
jgi:CopA family copper-resistance protein